MKHLFSIFLVTLVLTSCKTQEINTEYQPKSKKPYLLGKIDKTAFSAENYATWFQPNYKNYKSNPEVIKGLKQYITDYDITFFMGTWCGDSKREVPKFYKILDAVNFPMKQLTAVAVSREPDMYKESPQHEEAGLNIVRVPTFIIFKSGKEVNRIIERPIATLEEDLLKIVTGQDYKPNYFGVKKKQKQTKK